MASILRVDTLTDTSSNNSTAMSTINQGTAKSWVNFNGTGTSAGTTITSRDSFNISSVLDVAVGDYTVTISSAMANVNYAHVGTAGQGNTALINLSQCFDIANPTTTASRYQTAYVNGGLIDASNVHPALHGDLA
jgi:hypothetical protein